MSPISDKTLYAIADDINRYTRKNYERILVELGLYSIHKLQSIEEGYVKILVKKEFILITLNEIDTDGLYKLVDTLYEKDMLSPQTVNLLSDDGYEIIDAHESNLSNSEKSAPYSLKPRETKPSTKLVKESVQTLPEKVEPKKKGKVKSVSNPIIIAALIGFIGTIAAATIGYLAARSGAEIPIKATQTAEAMLTLYVATLSNETPPSDGKISKVTAESSQYPSIESTSIPTVLPTGGSEKLFHSLTWPIVFRDTFDSNNSDWPLWNIQRDSAIIKSEVKDGTYHWEYTPKLNKWYWFSAPLYSYSNFYLSVNIRRLPGNDTYTWYGVAFRVQGNKAYIFYIDDNQKYYFGLYDNDVWTDIIGETRISQILPGKFNELSVIGDDSEISLFVNKTPVGSIIDNSLSQGNIFLLFGGSSGEEVIIEFDNFELREKP